MKEIFDIDKHVMNFIKPLFDNGMFENYADIVGLVVLVIRTICSDNAVLSYNLARIVSEFLHYELTQGDYELTQGDYELTQGD